MNMPHQCGKTQGKELVKYCCQGTSPCIVHNSKTRRGIFIQLLFHRLQRCPELVSKDIDVHKVEDKGLSCFTMKMSLSWCGKRKLMQFTLFSN